MFWWLSCLSFYCLLGLFSDLKHWQSSEIPTQMLSHGSNVPQSTGWAVNTQSWMMIFLHKDFFLVQLAPKEG